MYESSTAPEASSIGLRSRLKSSISERSRISHYQSTIIQLFAPSSSSSQIPQAGEGLISARWEGGVVSGCMAVIESVVRREYWTVFSVVRRLQFLIFVSRTPSLSLLLLIRIARTRFLLPRCGENYCSVAASQRREMGKKGNQSR